jgi:flagellar biosynthetic protein FlhB
VLAKGVDTLALKIRKIAAENGIPVTESPPLARALHAACEPGMSSRLRTTRRWPR